MDGDAFQKCCNFSTTKQTHGQKWKTKHCHSCGRSYCARRMKPIRRNCHLPVEDYVKKSPSIKPTRTRWIENPVRHNHASCETRSNVVGFKNMRKKIEKNLKLTESFSYPDHDDDDDNNDNNDDDNDNNDDDINKHDGKKRKDEVGYEAKSAHNITTINKIDDRNKLLHLFRVLYKVLKREEQEGKLFKKRIDIEAYQVLKQSGKLFNFPRIIGPIPDVNIQDEFEFRVELMITGLHFHSINGIDYKMGYNGKVLATSIVATEGYLDIMVKSDWLVYVGEGGLFEDKGKNMKDQELKKGNLALKNSIQEGNFIRVVRGVKPGPNYVSSLGRTKKVIFIYDGLYKVVDYTEAVGTYGNKIYQFKLKRCPGQKSILWGKYK